MFAAARRGCIAALLALLGQPVHPGRAETVLLQPQNGEKGHGWLFGADGPGAGECWIAVPLHVIRGFVNEAPEPFIFTDRQGRSGETGVPVAVSSSPQALQAAGGEADLAFARVEAGPRRGCLSRLGLPALSYDVLIGTNPRLLFSSQLATSYGLFEATIDRSGVGARLGGQVRLEPLKREDTHYLVGGLSGATATVSWSGETVPFAMALRVDKGRIEALRFDRLRAAFKEIQTARPEVGQAGEGGGLAYRITQFEATSLRPGSGPSLLAKGQGCWGAEAPKAGGTARLTLDVAAAPRRLNRLVIDHPASCGPAPERVIIEHKVPTQSLWSVASECRVARDAPSTSCRLDLTTPRQLRLSFKTAGPFALSGLRLQ